MGVGLRRGPLFADAVADVVVPHELLVPESDPAAGPDAGPVSLADGGAYSTTERVSADYDAHRSADGRADVHPDVRAHLGTQSSPFILTYCGADLFNSSTDLGAHVVSDGGAHDLADAAADHRAHAVAVHRPDVEAKWHAVRDADAPPVRGTYECSNDNALRTTVRVPDEPAVAGAVRDTYSNIDTDALRRLARTFQGPYDHALAGAHDIAITGPHVEAHVNTYLQAHGL